MDPAVSTERLTKDFTTGFWRPKPHRALDDLTIDIPQGGVFGLLGPNGAGKSTTLKLMLHLLRPSAGRARVFGLEPGHIKAHRRMGFLPENPAFYGYLSADELLVYFAGLFGYPAAECRLRAARMLDRVGLADADRSRPLRHYSKGMIQRVGLAQALINDPELVILDEPMSGLDPVGRREVREIILGLRDEGRTVLFSSHILSDAELLCSRVAILAKGRLVAAGTLDDLTAGAARGWEVVATGVTPDLLRRLEGRRVRARAIDVARVSFDLEAGERPEPFVAELAAAGAALVSIAPIRTSLEDVFMELVR